MKAKCNLIQACLVGTMLWNNGSLESRGASIQDVQHVVILMQENRSFDHYYGTMRGVRGYNDPNILLFQNGSSDLFQLSGTNFILPFKVTTPCDINRMAYYTRTNLPFYYSLADTYTICDANFSSFPGPTFPNRLYLFTGTVDPGGTNGGPALNNNLPASGYSWTTYPERLQAAGVSWKVYRPTGDWFGDALQWFTQYRNATNGNPLFDRGMATVNDPITAFMADVTNGTLPQVSWIAPLDLTVSEHAPYSVERGEWFVARALAALAANPAVFNSTVFIFNYDEEGGYFDHVPPPVAPPGTAGEFATNGTRLGLGTRVPMIIVSPWTRGGRVCSQVFDHTSIIRFLETWTGVQEPNISAWRRQACGDLTSAFDFAHPVIGVPNLPPAPLGDCTGIVLTPPAVQSVPVQEPGIRPACPLPYQPDASCYTDCNSNRLFISMTNAGTASVHFAIYANAYRAFGPWHYDAPPGRSVKDSFVLPRSPGANGLYDFTCYGPNGFQRRFAGNAYKDCNQVEVRSQINPDSGSLTLGLLNPSATTVNFTVTNSLNPDLSWTFALAPADSTNCTFDVQTDNQGWYDLTVTTDADTNFVRHLAGHIETGSVSITETPAIFGNTLVVPTNTPTNPPVPMIGSIYEVAAQLIAQNSLANAGTNSLALTIGFYGTNCALIYPGWASNYVVEVSENPVSSPWTQLNVTPTVISNCNVIILPVTNMDDFFRLRY